MMKRIAPLILLLFLIPTISAKTTLEIKPSEISVDNGEIFNITLIISPEEEIDTVATDLITWNNNILECMSVKRETLFDDALIWIPGEINNEEGKIELMVWGSQIPTNIQGNYITISFKAIDEGETDILVDYDEYGVARAGVEIDKEILNNCHVICGAGASPLNIEIPQNLMIYIISFIIIISGIIIFIFLNKKVNKKSGDDDIFN